jgi:undecaprenyl-diphosphatase
MAGACIQPVSTAADRQHRKMAVLIVLATLPALLVGGLAPDFVETYLRDVTVIAWTTLGFGILLGVVDRFSPRDRGAESLGMRDALLIGLAQAAALVPGVSRSGITMTAGRMLGLSPDAAARFSFLMAVPIIAAAGSYGVLRVAEGRAGIDWLQLCIAGFLALIRRFGLMPFVIYRIFLGVALLWLLY